MVFLSYWDIWAKLVLHWLIQDLNNIWIPIIDLKILPDFERLKEEVP